MRLFTVEFITFTCIESFGEILGAKSICQTATVTAASKASKTPLKETHNELI